MPTANEDLLDAAILHQVELLKYSNGVVRKMIAILNDTDKDLYAQLLAALERLPADAFTIQRLQSLLGSVRGINANAYAQIGRALTSELRDFTDFEVQYQQMMLSKNMPSTFSVGRVPVDVVAAAALDHPFQGMLLSGALDGLAASRARRIERSVALGYVQGKTTDQIVRELRGTVAAGRADGITEIDRRDLRTIVHTAVAHTANFAKQETYKANEDILQAVMWSATLDTRTSEICRIRDHKTWTLDGEPIGHDLPWLGGPPAHFNCRSCTVPVLKSFSELLGLPGIDESSFPEGTRASMDGQVAKDMNYNEWLTKQSASRQDEVLGPTRGKLLREGKLTADQMYTRTGDYMTLEQLRARYPEAFK